MKKNIKLLVNICLIFIFIYNLICIYSKLDGYKKAEKTYDKIQEIQTSNVDDNPLHKMNPDYKFWIEIDNTNINYPVVQGKDNEFYLHNDFNKNISKSGSVFMDYRNTLLSDSNTVIYGHNMKNKTMFSQLENFKEEDFFNENNKIRITLKDKVYIYEVFSVYYTEPSYNYIFLNFKSKDEHNRYIDNVVKKSIYKSNVNVDCNDRIITLSTCSYELKDTRTVVHAKLTSIKNKE